MYIPLARVEASLDKSQLLPLDFGIFHFMPCHQGYEMMLLVIAKATGLSAKGIQFLPIGGLILPILYFAVSKKIFKSTLFASLLIIYVSYDPTLIPGHYNVFAYAWTRALFLIFILIYIRLLREKRLTEIPLLILTFIGTFSIYWTTSGWMILFAISVNLILLSQIVIGKDERAKRRLTLNMTLIFIVIYLMFSDVFYHEFLEVVLRGRFGSGPQEALPLFYTQLEGLLIGTSALAHEKYLVAPTSNPIVGWTLLFRYLVILVPIAIYILVRLKRFCKTKSMGLNKLDVHSYLLWPLFIVGILHTLTYIAYGHVSFRYIVFMFPIVTLLCLGRLRVKTLFKTIALIILLILVIVGFISFVESFLQPTKYADIEPSADWLSTVADEKSVILTELDTAGKYLVVGASHELFFSTRCYNSSKYEKLVESRYYSNRNEELKNIADYIVMDKKSAHLPIVSVGWKYYEPLSYHIEAIENNVNIHKVYDDGAVWIFRTY
jgi:hypothetical protein